MVSHSPLAYRSGHLISPPFSSTRLTALATPTKRSFRLPGADGGPLRGDVRTAAPARPAVVVCHGFKGFKDWGFFPFIAERLARAGLSAVSFNFTGSGVGEDGETFSEAERFGRNTYSREIEDLGIVLDALHTGALGVQPSAYGLLGHSLGGSIAILRAAADPGVRALVTWAAVARLGSLWQPEDVPQWRRLGRLAVVNQRTGEVLSLYTDILEDLEAHAATRLDVLRAAGAVRVPWLVAHGAADESVPVAAAREIHGAARAAGSQLLLVEGAGHTFGAQHPFAGPTPALEQLAAATVAWFGRHLA